MNGVRILDMVIETSLTKQGSGRAGDHDPVRLIVQYWDQDGNLLAQRDTWLEPEPGCYDSIRLAHFTENLNKPRI